MNFVIENTRNINVRPIFTQINTSIKQVIQECIDEYKADNINITLIAHNNINFPGPKNMLQSVCHNIIDNAFRHGGATTNIEIIISENYVIFQDSGCGIKQGCTNHIFDIFTSSKENHLGIGLTVCKEIINNYGGSIRCISLEGHHTTLIIKFPK
jgi:signal transduction histidine kinase